MKILVINPGSTSTKVAVFEDESPLLVRNIAHTPEQLACFDDVIEQQDFRRQLVLDELRQANIPVDPYNHRYHGLDARIYLLHKMG